MESKKFMTSSDGSAGPGSHQESVLFFIFHGIFFMHNSGSSFALLHVSTALQA
jgi:hypothetical protein